MRVDIHTHFIPPEFIRQARRGKALDKINIQEEEGQEWIVHPQGYRYPLLREFWDLEAKLEKMKRLEITRSLLSIAPTLFFYWLPVEAVRDFCRMANESVAQIASQSGGRILGLATVPLQDPEAAAAELRRGVEQLGLRGALIGTSVETMPLDDPLLDPFFTTAEKLGVPVILHPSYVGLRPEFADFYMTNLIGNPLGTCVSAARLILSGFLDRHPNLKIVLVHGGGFLPYQIGRLDHGYRVRPETSSAIKCLPSSYLRHFHFDTITHAGAPLRFLVSLVGADRVLLGTDIPFDMADQQFETHCSVLEKRHQEAIYAGNAVRLFGLDDI